MSMQKLLQRGATRFVIALVLINIAGYFALNLFGNLVSDVSTFFDIPETLVGLTIIIVTLVGAVAVLSLPLRRR